ncbi:MAG TPA: hypothetical protein VJ873_02335, partial [bacterium]|nr:hypothetical protein [bacterium]
EDTHPGGLAVLNGSFFNPALTSYTAEADFELNTFQNNLGIFGLAFETGSDHSFYSFQWSYDGSASRGTPDWELEKNNGTPNTGASYLAHTTTPAYTLGSTVHLKVVVNGNNFQCYVNLNDGAGDRLVFNVTDMNSPYTGGSVGLRTYGIRTPMVVKINNFTVSSFSPDPPTPTATATSTATGTPTPTASPTPVCIVSAVYSDNFSSDTLGNYDFFDAGTQAPGTAAGEGYGITEDLLVNYLSASPYGGMAVVKNALFSRSITDYTVEADFAINYLHTANLFGLVFRTGDNGSFYSFQYNANTNNASHGSYDWELEKNTGSPSVTHVYEGYAIPPRNLPSGSFVHLKAVALGSRFQCYLNFYDGVGDRLMVDATDNDAPYTSGGVGMRTLGGFLPPNSVYIRNFSVSGCAGAMVVSNPAVLPASMPPIVPAPHLR